MRGKKLCWALVIFMLVNIIAGFQMAFPMEVRGESAAGPGTGLSTTQSAITSSPATEAAPTSPSTTGAALAGSPTTEATSTGAAIAGSSTTEAAITGPSTTQAALKDSMPVKLASESETATPAALDWQKSIFGSNTTTDNSITPNDDGSVTIASLNGKGKISKTVDGIAYYNVSLPASSPFQITADIKVNSFSTADNQISFGVMLRNNINTNGVSNFVAVGAYSYNMTAFCRTSETTPSVTTAAGISAAAPTTGSAYQLTLTSTDNNKCIVSCGSSSTIIDTKDMFTNGTFYIGFFAARRASITVSNISLNTSVSGITLSSTPAKLEYFQGQSLDLSGLSVTAAFKDNTTKTLDLKDLYIAGFDSEKTGSQAVTVYYLGRSETFNVNVKALVCESLSMGYTPAKTTYYIGDQFDTSGMVVNGTFNTGATRALDPAEYTMSGFDSSTAGHKTVTVSLAANSEVNTSFDVTIRPSQLLGVEITRKPVKTVYYLGETLDLNGLVVTARYGDSSSILQSGEYTADSSGFDTKTEGEKTIVITHKGKSVNLALAVKARKLAGIAVTTLPKTTYYAGESVTTSGIVISKMYDNGDAEVLAPDAFTIDTTAFVSTPGSYDITVVPKDSTLSPVSYKVTVRPQKTYTWNSVIFGQSSSSTRNFVTPSAIGTADGTIALTALTGGGKVTGAHDGISFYYTTIDAAKDNFVLSADVKVIEFAKDTPDNQEAFGLMVRDAIGKNGDSNVFSSNVAAVGGYRGLTNGFMRTGVTNPAGSVGTLMTATSWATERPGLANTSPNKTYRLMLSKNNSGFTVSLNGAKETTSFFYSPDDFNYQDPNLYVGFYAARLATIEVSNVSFSVSDAQMDAPRVTPPAAAVTPSLSVTSLANVSKTAYSLKFVTNINGTVTIKQGETILANDTAVTANREFSQNTTIAANSSTNFTITLVPDATQSLTSYDKIITNYTVTMKTYDTPSGLIYVSPSGTSAAKGTLSSPLDLDTALTYIREGQIIYMRGGTYNRTTPVIIPMDNDGTESRMKTLAACPGETPVLDFSNAGKSTIGFQLGGDYWHIRGIQVTKAGSTGFNIGGNNNIVEQCVVFANGNTGMQISRFAPNLTNEFWPSNNLILNCEAYDNRDASENNADGFAAKLTCGEGNVFRGCISHNNIDDGWDLYTKAETGPIGAVLIDGCIAYNNGTLTNGQKGAGDKNGFKLGGEGIAVQHIIKNSIAFGNGATGFTSNSNPAVRAYNCISFNNALGNIVFTTYNTITGQFIINGFISYRTDATDMTVTDSYPASSADASNYFWDGTASVNKSGAKLTDSYFTSLTPSLPYKRDCAGNIIWDGFLVPASQTSSNTSTTPAPAPAPVVTHETKTVPALEAKPTAKVPTPSVDKKGNASLTIASATIPELLEKSKADADGIKNVGLVIPEVPGASSYSLVLPASNFNAAALSQKVEVKTAVGTVAIPGNMLSNAGLGASDIALSIASVSKSALSAEIQAKIGDRPVIELSVSTNGKSISYNNPKAPVTVSIPYKPTADELKDPEHIVVWYIDGTGAATPVSNGKYDAAAGMVIFTTSHFSRYAITTVYKTFDDLQGVNWAKKEIEVLASKEIISGTAEKTFAPSEKITRADFIVWMVKALGFSAEVKSNFSDVDSADSYYNAVGTAKELGIVNGVGDGKFNPKASISRQEMFTITARALKLVKKLAANGSSADLKAFRDKTSIASFAVSDIASLVKDGFVKGSAGTINPLGNTTRAEAAVFLYRAYNK